jgi:hypothetical protein
MDSSYDDGGSSVASAFTARSGNSMAAAAIQAADVNVAAAGDDESQYLPPAFVPREEEVERLAGEVARVRSKVRAHNMAVVAGAAPPAAIEVEMAISSAV